MIPKSCQLGAGGGKGEGPFRIFFVPGAPLGANMVQRPVPRASWTAQTWLLDALVSIFHKCLHVFFICFSITFSIMGGRGRVEQRCPNVYLVKIFLLGATTNTSEFGGNVSYKE